MTARGIVTVADLKARCKVDPVTHCWHWQGASSKGRPSIYTVDYSRGAKRSMQGSRAAWFVAHQAPIPDGHMAYRCCGTIDCVNPAHLRLMASQAEMGTHIRRSGRHRGVRHPAREDSMRRARAAQGVVDTPAELVLEIRRIGYSMPAPQIAQRLGLKLCTVHRIRQGRTRRGVGMGAA